MTCAPHSPHRPVTALVLALTLASAAPALAGCTVSTSGLAFGVYQPLSFAGQLTSSDVYSTATVSVSCDAVAGYSLKLGPSPVENSTYPRYMGHASGGNPMVFNVYTDATHGTVWGDGSVGGLVTHGPLNGTAHHVVYGRIPARQHMLKAGSFSSALTVTVSYDL